MNKKASEHCSEAFFSISAEIQLQNLLFRLNVLHGQVYTALVVDLHDLNPNHVAFLDSVLNLLDAVVSHLGDVNHTVLARQQVYECAEVHQADNLAVVDFARLRAP